jgi:RNA polymerase sigma-70 factor (ECF subfamily)
LAADAVGVTLRRRVRVRRGSARRARSRAGDVRRQQSPALLRGKICGVQTGLARSQRYKLTATMRGDAALLFTRRSSEPSLDAALFTVELDRHRRYLLRVARLQLRDADAAEDVVQETLVAALTAREGFTGRSSIKTWLTGILKHKIVDAIRHRQRQPVLAASFDWGDPENALSRQEFMTVMEICLEKLPPNTARVFVMREVLELETEEICKELTITANNLWVILYRARMSLRECLERNWFSDPARS